MNNLKLIIAGACLLASTTVLAQGRTGTGAPAQEAYNAGVQALQNDDYKAAEEKFTEAINLDGGLVDAYWQLATVHYRNRKYADAIAVLRKCPDQKNVNVREQLGLALYQSKTIGEAVNVLESVVAEKPDAYAAQLQLGKHYDSHLEPKKAVVALSAYLKSRPPALAGTIDDKVHAMLALNEERVAQREQRLTDWQAAAHEYEALARQKPNALEYKLGLGTAYAALDQLGEPGSCNRAITLYERILNDASKAPSIYYNLGQCYLRVGRPSDAAREAELYTRAKAGDNRGFVLLGESQFQAKNYQAALNAFLNAERNDETSGSIKTKLGKTYLAMHNYPAALAKLEIAAKASPNDVDVLIGLAEVYAATNASKEKLMQQASRLAAMARDSRAQNAAALDYYAAGNDDLAMQASHAALAIDPNSGAARQQLLKALNRKAGASVEKDASHAQALLEEATHLAPDDLMSNRNLGLVLISEKKFPEAQKALERALRKVPNDMVVNRLLGRALVGQSQVDAAVVAYEKAAQVALLSHGVPLAGIYAELGPLYLETERLDQAVTVLEQAARDAQPGTPLAQVVQRNLAIAYFRRGSQSLRDPKKADSALDDITKAEQAPKGTFNPKELNALTCGEAFAALHAGKIGEAQEAFGRAVTTGGCALRPPYDKLGVALFAAYANYRDSGNPTKRELAARQLAALQSKTSGVAAEWVKQLLRSCYEFLAYDYFQRSDEKRAESFLKNARGVKAKGDTRELEHNQAALDLAQGRAAAAEKVFDAMAGRPPESLVNLGILRDKQGDAKKALELYKRALEKGARAPKLKEWIDVKERLFEVKS